MPRLWTRNINTLEISIVPKVIYKFNEIPTKIPTGFYVDINKLILKLTWKDEKPRIPKTILKNKNNVVEIILSKIKVYYKATITKGMWYWWEIDT